MRSEERARQPPNAESLPVNSGERSLYFCLLFDWISASNHKYQRPPHRLRSRYFHSHGTVCRALKGARFTFSGISSTASGEGLATGRPVLCFAFFLFVDIAIPVLFLSCESSPPLRKEHQLSAQSRLSGLRKPMSGPVFLVSQNPVRRYPTCPLFPEHGCRC